MAAIWQQPSFAAPFRSRIRAVVADFDLLRRDTVHRALLDEQSFDVLAKVTSPEECRRIVMDEVPELVICPAAFVSEQAFPGHSFPVFITMGKTDVALERCVLSLDDPIREAHVLQALMAATDRILTVKAAELSNLIHQYVLHSDTDSTGRVCVEKDGCPVLLRIDEIRWVKASGNYVKLYTDSGIFPLRESMQSFAARLGRHRFARIHRGAIVNVRAIAHQVMKNDVVAAIVLTDGTLLHVGPNFRDQVPESTPVRPDSKAS